MKRKKKIQQLLVEKIFKQEEIYSILQAKQLSVIISCMPWSSKKTFPWPSKAQSSLAHVSLGAYLLSLVPLKFS